MNNNELKFQREMRGLTQTDLSKATNLPQNTISHMEKENSNPTIKNLEVIADYYGITIDELKGREPKKNGMF